MIINAKDEKDIGNEASIIGEEEFIINYKDLGIKPTKKPNRDNRFRS